jgi:hypothetical protein
VIQLREDICWVVGEDGRRSPFDGPRLTASIRLAATRAGERDWWPAESVTEAVWLAIRECCAGNTITADEVVRTVLHMLNMTGYTRIAEAYAARHLFAEIFLDQLTTDGSAACELSFFHLLDTALRTAARRGTAAVEVRGLRACVMRLRGARHWSASCRRLAEDIVSHVRERVTRGLPAGPERAVRLLVTD